MPWQSGGDVKRRRLLQQGARLDRAVHLCDRSREDALLGAPSPMSDI